MELLLCAKVYVRVQGIQGLAGGGVGGWGEASGLQGVNTFSEMLSVHQSWHPHRAEPPLHRGTGFLSFSSQAQMRLSLHTPTQVCLCSGGQASLRNGRELCLLTPQKLRKSPGGIFTAQMARLIKRFGSQVASGCLCKYLVSKNGSHYTV